MRHKHSPLSVYLSPAERHGCRSATHSPLTDCKRHPKESMSVASVVSRELTGAADWQLPARNIVHGASWHLSHAINTALVRARWQGSSYLRYRTSIIEKATLEDPASSTCQAIMVRTSEVDVTVLSTDNRHADVDKSLTPHRLLPRPRDDQFCRNVF